MENDIINYITATKNIGEFINKKFTNQIKKILEKAIINNDVFILNVDKFNSNDLNNIIEYIIKIVDLSDMPEDKIDIGIVDKSDIERVLFYENDLIFIYDWDIDYEFNKFIFPISIMHGLSYETISAIKLELTI